MKLEYGMKVIANLTVAQYVIGGIAIHSADKTRDVECTIEKYWESDEDANQYKVKLVPISEKDKLMCGTNSFYSSDLSKMLETGRAYRLIQEFDPMQTFGPEDFSK